MIKPHTVKLERAIEALPLEYPGPGGVAGVVSDGEVITARAWGYADLAWHRQMLASTRLPICSISKQFTCGVLLARLASLDELEGGLGRLLPRFKEPLPSVAELCHNQSGLRDYWALSVLLGASAGHTFSRDDAIRLFEGMESGHFAPGTRYSYSNGNYRLLAELVEAETGSPLEAHYRDLIWGPAGMETAVAAPDTRFPVDEVIGYEGNAVCGFYPAVNGIYWTGDAGISASLTDMLAYESWIDRHRDDEGSLYARMTRPVTFKDGTPAAYGYGVARGKLEDMDTTGHGGALRGFSAYRLHIASRRLSVFVAFNHEADAQQAALRLARAALGLPEPRTTAADESWRGRWMCSETGLLCRIDAGETGAFLNFSSSVERLLPASDGSLHGPGVVVVRRGPALRMLRKNENLVCHLEPLESVETADAGEIAGRYVCDELGAAMVIEAADGGVYARFEGFLGAGPMELVRPAGPDMWTVATRRTLDAPAPGDWTLSVRRGTAGAVTGCVLGCWLARGLRYHKVA
ncbi:D-aminopeptidase [Mesorhizobium sp. CAU 1741]|uniref:D-aminopeptidase n=1 Tax=Mesorhizobium sp. CAU 1741 TaxID=3140366 RepID=UPI00325A57C5